MKQAVLVLSGSFNPVTKSHFRALLIGKKHLEQLRYNVVKLVLSPTHERYPYKRLQSSQHRVAMIELSIAQQATPSLFELCTLEIEAVEGFQPLYKAMSKIRAAYSNVEVFMLCGEDMLLFMCQQDKWHSDHLEQLFAAVSVLAVRRPGGKGAVAKDGYLQQWKEREDLARHLSQGKIEVIDEDAGEFSSSAVREGDFTGCYDVVKEYIKTNRLYSI